MLAKLIDERHCTRWAKEEDESAALTEARALVRVMRVRMTLMPLNNWKERKMKNTK